MFCYQCGCRLSEQDYCTACGADVALYKKIMHVSNRFYNDGLERAMVRDLSGAINSLRQSLKFNKNNIEARNLLGLVYFEMGEAVAALSEWVISKNIRPEKNIADSYIELIQTNASRLDVISQAIKKYNQAYHYCVQGSQDLAIIQLKKVLSLMPGFVKAHLLLALLYIQAQQWDKAGREVQRCLAIDRNNTMALRYLKEVEMVVNPDGQGKENIKKGGNDGSVRYRSDNEIIIQPVNVKEQRSIPVSGILNIAIGLIIGFAAMYFLVVPAKMAGINSEANQKLAQAGSQLDAKTAEITDLESRIASLEGEKKELEQKISGYTGTDGVLSDIDRMLNAAAAYLETQDVHAAGEQLEGIASDVDLAGTSDAFRRLYQALLTAVGPQLSDEYFKAGQEAYKNNQFDEAVLNLEKAVIYDAADQNALYQLGEAYRQDGKTKEALDTYGKVIELFPGTDRAKRAQRRIEELSQ